MADARDAGFMARALQLARLGLYTAHPNPRVGCIIVLGGTVVGEGWHQRTGEPHAEALALRVAGERARGATAYVTLEPCCHSGRTPPCARALIDAGVARVVYAVRDPNPRVNGGGHAALESAGIAVEGGLREAEARELNPGFFSRMERGRPWVRTKLAASLDGRTALANGASRWITGDAARRDVHRLRARSSAVITGIGTVLADDPVLTVREADLAGIPQPWRVVVDSRLRTPTGARLLGEGGATRIFCGRAEPAARAALEAAGAVVEEQGGPAVDLPAMLARLAELGANEVLVEAGPALNGALIRAGLVDELVVYVAPRVLGGGARGMFDFPDPATLAECPQFIIGEVRRVGRDLRIVYRPGG